MPIFGEGALATILTRVNTILGLVQTPVYWKTQLPVDYITTIVEDPIIQNKWYTATADLSVGVPAKLWYIIVEQTNNGNAAETIVLSININGTEYTHTWAANDNTRYYLFIAETLAAGDFNLTRSVSKLTVGDTALVASVAIPFQAESVGLVRTRQTTAVDPVAAQIEVNLVWEELTRAPAM